MTEYHPLDVRHPANRDLLRRNYLLDPPRALATPVAAPAAAGQREAFSRPDYNRAPATSSAPATRLPSAPWGRNRPAPIAQESPRRRGGWVQTVFLIGLFAVIFASQTGFIDPALDWLRRTAWELGISLPF